MFVVFISCGEVVSKFYFSYIVILHQAVYVHVCAQKNV